MQRRDAVRQFVETNFPGGLAAMNNAATALPADSAPGPLVIPASATPVQMAALGARRQLALALHDATAPLRANPNATPKQRRDFVRGWTENPGLALWRQANQTSHAVGQESQQSAMQRMRQKLAASDPVAEEAVIAAIPTAGSLLSPSAALTAQWALDLQTQRIMTRADLTTPLQRRDALRGWREANKARIDAVHAALEQVSSSTAPSSPVSVP